MNIIQDGQVYLTKDSCITDTTEFMTEKRTMPVKAAINSKVSPRNIKWQHIIPNREKEAHTSACLNGENLLAIPGTIMI